MHIKDMKEGKYYIIQYPKSKSSASLPCFIFLLRHNNGIFSYFNLSKKKRDKTVEFEITGFRINKIGKYSFYRNEPIIISNTFKGRVIKEISREQYYNELKVAIL